MSLDLNQLASLAGIVTPQQELDVENTVMKCVAIANNHWNVEFPIPVVKFDLRGTTAGQLVHEFNGRPAFIRMNIQLLHSDNYKEMIEQTLPHEVAHHIQRIVWPKSKPHGYEWQYVMRVLGVKADRTHSMRTTKARKVARPHSYACHCQIHNVTNLLHKRMLQGHIYTCRKCNGRLVYTGGNNGSSPDN